MVEISMVIVRRKNSIYNWIEHHLLSFYDPFWEEFETSFCEETHMAKAVTYCAQNKKLGFLCRYVAAFLRFIVKNKKKEKKNDSRSRIKSQILTQRYCFYTDLGSWNATKFSILNQKAREIGSKYSAQKWIEAAILHLKEPGSFKMPSEIEENMCVNG